MRPYSLPLTITRTSRASIPFAPCDDGCEHSQKAYEKANKIEGDYTRNGWVFKTSIPHATFEIIEDNERYCMGLVFNISDLI